MLPMFFLGCLPLVRSYYCSCLCPYLGLLVVWPEIDSENPQSQDSMVAELAAPLMLKRLMLKKKGRQSKKQRTAEPRTLWTSISPHRIISTQIPHDLLILSVSFPAPRTLRQFYIDLQTIPPRRADSKKGRRDHGGLTEKTTRARSGRRSAR